MAGPARKEVSVMLALVWLAVGCQGPGSNATFSASAETPVAVAGPHYSQAIMKRLGGGAVSVVQSPVRVTAYRLWPKSFFSDDIETHESKLLGHSILSRAQVNTGQIDQLREMLLGARGHEPPIHHWCGFFPGIAFRFEDDHQSLTVLVCFECKEWRIWRGQKYLTKSAIDGVEGELLSLACQLFPDDAVLKSLESPQGYARTYRVAGSDIKRNMNERMRFEDEWERRIIAAVTPAARWSKPTGRDNVLWWEDGEVHIHTTRQGHEALSAVEGMRRVPHPLLDIP